MQHVELVPASAGIEGLQQNTRASLRILMLLATVVLLIACANVANLLLARSTAQRGEIAVCIGLGATRGRILRQIVTESLVLSAIGGVVGMSVASLGSHAILSLAFPQATNVPISAIPSGAVLGFAFGVSLLTGLLFSVAPAWVSSHAQPADASRANRNTSRDHARAPPRLLIVFQFALSVVLLASAFLMTRTLYNLEHQRLGIESANRYVVQLDMKGAGYALERLPALYQEIEQRFGALPGIMRVSFAMYLPMEGSEWGSCVVQQGHPAPQSDAKCFSDWDRVSAGFLQSIGAPVLRGRGLMASDDNSGQRAVIVNEAFAKQFFPGQDPVGKRFGFDSPRYSSDFEIVGVFRDFKLSDARLEPHSLFLRPSGQRLSGHTEADFNAGEADSMYLSRMVLEFKSPQRDAEKLVRGTMQAIDPALPVIQVIPYPDLVAGNFSQDRLIMRLSAGFGILALVLAAVGLYGVMSYVAARRTVEIGVRMAMGASRGTIVSMVLRAALVQVLIGVGIGIPASLYVGHLMTALLYQVSGHDVSALLGATVVLAIATGSAALIPAIRAASLDPMRALRTE